MPEKTSEKIQVRLSLWCPVKLKVAPYYSEQVYIDRFFKNVSLKWEKDIKKSFTSCSNVFHRANKLLPNQMVVLKKKEDFHYHNHVQVDCKDIRVFVQRWTCDSINLDYLFCWYEYWGITVLLENTYAIPKVTRTFTLQLHIRINIARKVFFLFQHLFQHLEKSKIILKRTFFFK